MTYRIEGKTSGVLIDLHRFAEDLCRAMGGTDFEKGSDLNDATFRLDADQIRVLTHYSDKRVRVSISAPDVPWRDRRNASDADTETATIDPDKRTIERIAADIRKRVVEASAQALANQRKHATKLAELRAEYRRRTPELEAMGLRVTPTSDGTELNLYGAGELSFSARLMACGGVHVERIGSIPLAKFERVVAILNEPIRASEN